MKTVIIAFWSVVAIFFALSGWILERSLLKRIPGLIAMGENIGLYVDIGGINSSHGFTTASFELADITVEINGQTYKNPKLELEFSIFSPLSPKGILSGSHIINGTGVKTAPIPVQASLGKSGMIEGLVTDITPFSLGGEPLFALKQADILFSWVPKGWKLESKGQDVVFAKWQPPLVKVVDKFEFLIFKEVGDPAFYVERAVIFTPDINVSADGRVEADGFALNTHIEGWQRILNYLEEEQLIKPKQANLARISLSLLSINGILSIPLVYQENTLYVAKIPLLKFKLQPSVHPAP